MTDHPRDKSGSPRTPEWVRHTDYYVHQGAVPGVPGDAPSHEELRRQHWGPVRRLPSAVLGSLLRAYRTVISPLYGQVCSYYPSCSAYGLEAVTVHGTVRGTGLTAWRILRCNPFSGGGVDHVPRARRIWPQGSAPSIIETNHPPIPPDPESAHDDGRPAETRPAPAARADDAYPADPEPR